MLWNRSLLLSPLLVAIVYSSTTQSPTSPSTREAVPRRIYFSPKRAQSGSVPHTVAFREALFSLSSPSAVLVQKIPLKYVIKDPKVSFKFKDVEYYWDFTYIDPTEEHPVICSNPIEPSDPKLGKISFANGSRPREIAWKCPTSHGCCGYECCEEASLGQSMLRLILLLVGIAVLSFFLLELVRWAFGCCSRYKHVPSDDTIPRRPRPSSSPHVAAAPKTVAFI